MIVIAVGWTAPAPSPCSARKAISAGMLQAMPQRIEPRMNAPTPISMIGLRPYWSLNLAKIGTDTAWASRKIEKSHGNCAKPPRSLTIEGTAVARMVESMATSPTLSMTDSRIGPRSERRPTSARVIVCVTSRGNSSVRRGIPTQFILAWLLPLEYPGKVTTRTAAGREQRPVEIGLCTTLNQVPLRCQSLQMHPRQEVPEALIRLATAQSGVVSREQVLSFGLSESAVDRLVSQYIWCRLARGVYLTAPVPPSWLALAWTGLVIGGDAARLGGAAAAHQWGMTQTEPRPTQILVPAAGSTPRVNGPWYFRRERPGARQSASYGNPPRTTIEDTVLDLIDDPDADPQAVVHWLTTAVQTRRTTPATDPQGRFVPALPETSPAAREARTRCRGRSAQPVGAGLPPARRAPPRPPRWPSAGGPTRHRGRCGVQGVPTAGRARRPTGPRWCRPISRHAARQLGDGRRTGHAAIRVRRRPRHPVRSGHPGRRHLEPHGWTDLAHRCQNCRRAA